MRVKAGLTEMKRKSRSITATASVMRAQHFAGDAALALGAADRGDVARGAGDAQRVAVGVARDDLAARAHPDPLAAGVADAVLGIVELGLRRRCVPAAASAPAAGLRGGSSSLRQSSVLIDSGEPWPSSWFGAEAVQSCCPGSFQSQNSSPEPHSARFRRASRSRISPSRVFSCWRRLRMTPPQQPGQQGGEREQGHLHRGRPNKVPADGAAAAGRAVASAAMATARDHAPMRSRAGSRTLGHPCSCPHSGNPLSRPVPAAV